MGTKTASPASAESHGGIFSPAMEAGLGFAMGEGGRTVGAGTVIKVLK